MEPYKNEKGVLIGPDRIWAKNEKYPGITITRTLGLSCGYKLGVTPEVEVGIYRVQTSFRYLVLASDGLWTVEDNDEVVAILEKSTPATLVNYTSSLMFEALKRWRLREELMDDISIIVVPLIFE